MKKKIIMLGLIIAPLVGCASLTDPFVPAIGGLPDSAIDYTDATTNDYPKAFSFIFGGYNTKTQLDALNQRVTNKREVNVLDWKQASERDAMVFKHTGKEMLDTLQATAEFQSKVVDPAVGWAKTGALALMTGGLGAAYGKKQKRTGDMDESEIAVLKAEMEAAAKAKIVAAALDDSSNVADHI